MFLGLIDTKISNNLSYSPLATFLHSSTILASSPFFGEKYTLSHFLENKRGSNPHPFCKVREI